jgi:polysaccharide pyruvyl transferase WcaK-like protein
VRIVSIGDIGVADNIIHIGDEAMFDELVLQLRQRGVDEIVALSSHPADSSERYGVTGIPRIGFFSDPNSSREDAEDRMQRVIRTAQGEAGLLRSNDTAHAVIDAVRSSDGVAIAGGGNIASTWPTHIFERATLGELARVFYKPLVISGQTIGPFLTDADAELVARLLDSATMVGLREGDSFELSRRLGVAEHRLNQTIDDASFVGIDTTSPRHSTEVPSAPYCAVTLAAHINGHDRDAVDRRLAELFDNIIETTGLDIVFFAHFGSQRDDEAIGDTVVHRRVMDRMLSPRVSIAPTSDSAAAARLSRGASLVVSSRYHPVVFAVSAGVPTVGISVDDYTTTKLTGALGNFGQHSVLPITGLLDGDGPAMVSDVWDRRALIRDSGVDLAVARRQASALWWDRVAASLAAPRVP